MVYLNIQYDMQFMADYGLSYYKNIYISNWLLDQREEFQLDFETGEPIPHRRQTNCDVELQTGAGQSK